jgi:hypothetical protein
VFQHSTQSNSFQDTSGCQNIKTADFARSATGKAAGWPGGRANAAGAVGGKRSAASAPITPDTFAFYVAESEQWQGKKTLVIDQESATVTLPPVGNTGVTVTLPGEWRKAQHYRTGPDTIEGTFPLKTRQELDTLLEHYTRVFGGGEDVPKGLRGYPYQRLCTDGVRLLYDTNNLSQGLHLIMGGEAIQRHNLRLGDSDALLATFIASQEHKFRATRFDIASDTDQVSMYQIWEAVKGCQLVTRTRKGRDIADIDPSTGERLSSTLYIGSVKSDRMTRFYDKAAEQSVDGVWTRCETQLRHTYAQIAFVAWLVGKVDIESVIASAIDFREVTGDSNKTRRPRVAWWAEWLGNYPHFNMVTVEKIEESVKRSLAWFKKQVAPTFAFLLRAMPDASWVASADTWGEFRMSPGKRAIVNSILNGNIQGVAYGVG